MRLLAVVLAALAACHAPPAHKAEPTATGPADRVETREPTAFSVEIRGGGRPVILIPGLGCPGSVWSGVIEQLRGRETHALTLAGFAGNPRIDGPLLETTVDELARYIRERRLESPILIGHSLGGTIAYWLAARAPELVGPVIVVDAGAPAGSRANASAAEAARGMWSDTSDQEFARRVKERFGQMAVRSERLAPVIAEVARSDRRALGDVAYELSTTNVRRELDKIRAPVLLILADGSLQDEFQRQGAAVRRREVVVVPGTGHFVMLDEPERFVAAVDRFLARHDAVAAN